jgi:HK97 family phage prohead protease
LDSVIHKSFDLVEVKAADDATGSFTALASVFGNTDAGGDRMIHGAFKNSLERWREKGDPIPIIFSHDWDNPESVIGKADPNEVVETEQGLMVNGKLDLEDNPKASYIHKLMKERLIKGWSFGYTVPKGGQERKDGANEVSEVDLIETGPTLKGMNDQAELQAVKAAEAAATEEPKDRSDEEPQSEAKDGRHDPLRDETDRWWLKVFGPK